MVRSVTPEAERFRKGFIDDWVRDHVHVGPPIVAMVYPRSVEEFRWQLDGIGKTLEVPALRTNGSDNYKHLSYPWWIRDFRESFPSVTSELCAARASLLQRHIGNEIANEYFARVLEECQVRGIEETRNRLANDPPPPAPGQPAAGSEELFTEQARVAAQLAIQKLDGSDEPSHAFQIRKTGWSPIDSDLLEHGMQLASIAARGSILNIPLDRIGGPDIGEAILEYAVLMRVQSNLETVSASAFVREECLIEVLASRQSSVVHYLETSTDRTEREKIADLVDAARRNPQSTKTPVEGEIYLGVSRKVWDAFCRNGLRLAAHHETGRFVWRHPDGSAIPLAFLHYLIEGCLRAGIIRPPGLKIADYAWALFEIEQKAGARSRKKTKDGAKKFNDALNYKPLQEVVQQKKALVHTINAEFQSAFGQPFPKVP